MILETERLILRMPQVQDVDEYMEFCNSEFVMRYNAMTPRTRERVFFQFSQSEGDTLLMVHKAESKVIGQICIEDDSLRYGVASKELSYFIREEFSRQGYMKEALTALINYLFETQNLQCIAARAFEPNVASRRLLASLGFHCDGVIPSCVLGYGDIVYDDTLHSLFRNAK